MSGPLSVSASLVKILSAARHRRPQPRAATYITGLGPRFARPIRRHMPPEAVSLHRSPQRALQSVLVPVDIAQQRRIVARHLSRGLQISGALVIVEVLDAEAAHIT